MILALAETQAPAVVGLPFVNWIFWATAAGGTLLVVGYTEWRGGTTLGFRRFMAGTIFAGAVIWLLSELSLPIPLGFDDFALAQIQRALVGLFLLLAGAYLVLLVVDRWRGLATGVAAVGGAVSLVALLVLATWRIPADPALFGALLLTASVSMGSVTAGMLLGHWYLVTPKLSPLPLRRLIVILIGALVAQGLLIAWSLVAVDTGITPVAWLTGLRFAVGIAFPLAVAVLALRATTAVSMQATTGLLYIGLAAVMVGTIGGVSMVLLGLAAV